MTILPLLPQGKKKKSHVPEKVGGSLETFLLHKNAKFKLTVWLFVSYSCREGDTRNGCSWHSRTKQRSIWHLTLSHQCWIFVKGNVTRLLGKQPFIWNWEWTRCCMHYVSADSLWFCSNFSSVNCNASCCYGIVFCWWRHMLCVREQPKWGLPWMSTTQRCRPLSATDNSNNNLQIVDVFTKSWQRYLAPSAVRSKVDRTEVFLFYTFLFRMFWFHLFIFHFCNS